MVCNSLGGLGREAWEWLVAAFRRKADGMQSMVEKQRVTMLLQTSLAEITIAVQNRNSMILDANATVVARERSQTLGEDDEVMADVQLGDVIEAGAGA